MKDVSSTAGGRSVERTGGENERARVGGSLQANAGGYLDKIYKLTAQIQLLQGCVCFEGLEKLRHLGGAEPCRRKTEWVAGVNFAASVERIFLYCRSLPTLACSTTKELTIVCTDISVVAPWRLMQPLFSSHARMKLTLVFSCLLMT
jgi:hypothetical protein